MPATKTVALHTLGCKLNYSETSSIERLLAEDGFERKDFNDQADVYVINTCSVTENADKECRQLVRRIQRRSPASFVVITGCYAQLKPEEIASIEGVDLVLGAAEKFHISRHLQQLTKGDPTKICSCDIDDVKEFTGSYSLNGRTRTFLKVQDGCDYNCSFCTIPMARGRSRSHSIKKVLSDISVIAKTGVKEIVLTGINLGDFGKDNAGMKTGENFFELLLAIEHFDGVPRYRVSSIEPNLLTNDIIGLVAKSGKIMPHFHIPLQSGSNKILGAMRRRYRRELYREKIESIHRLIPHCGIGVDVICGFPGETEEDFAETCHFLESLPVTYFHVFTYSERAGTHALDIGPSVPVNTRNERTRRLRMLSYEKAETFLSKNINSTRAVLFEGKHKNGMMDGYSDNYIRVKIPYKAEWENEVVQWTL
jgi:threonylcarbamoyladenosine tRNA methylthiotransferase MtaB